MEPSRVTLLISCPDEPGLIARITGVLHRHGGNIVENGEYVDPSVNRFFMRTAVEGIRDVDLLERVLKTELPAEANIRVGGDERKKVVLMATTEPHCLGDLLIRSAYGDLPMEVCGVISNHEALRKLSESFDIPFECISHEGLDREAHEVEVMKRIDAHAPDLVVMAKYMRILTPAFISRYKNRILNIHHSFLPAFVGANPYRQAWERGVKIIGATAHFASEVLDEGPIIAQDVIPVNHNHSPKDMARNGRDVEKRVLARAVRFFLEDRVVVTGNKTIVFE
ncbi:MAG: formyltetrahydrofolate deformylase [Verrucomicrobia bacterium]|nr:formyltetrahydrofolate deformylase [Verrucomicrobiota bacterium]MCH8513832.1 formyltetrahydrofolate deformylase [Kiritimatiellia bacterium]